MNVMRSMQILREASPWLAAAAAAGVAALAGIAADAWLPHTYTAVASVLVDTAPDDARGSSGAGSLPGSMATQVSLARSERVARRAAGALRLPADELMTDGGTAPSPAGPAELTRELMRRVEVRSESADSRVLLIVARAPAPQQAARLANAVAGAYLQTLVEVYPPAATVLPAAARSNPESRGVGRTQLLSTALAPDRASDERPRKRIALAALAGGLLALLAVVLREALQPRVRSARDLQSLSLPCLADLPHARWRRQPVRALRGAATKAAPSSAVMASAPPLRTTGGLR